MTSRRARGRRRLLTSLGLAAGLALVAAGPASATWSIVGVDQATGEVGVAIASCANFETTFAPTLVPGKGAAVSQANINRDSGQIFVKGLSGNASATAIIDQLTAPSADADQDTRVYGVVAFDRGADGYTGTKAPQVALDQQNTSATASAQGDNVTRAEVVATSLVAFNQTPGSLSNKLLAGLQAGSLAGGDLDCGDQRATAASLLVSKPGDKPYTATARLPDTFRAAIYSIYGREYVTRPDRDNVPSTFVSVLQTRNGDNAVDVLTRTYAEQRAAGNGPIHVRVVDPKANQINTTGAAFRILIAIILVVLLAIIGLAFWLVRRSAHRQAAAVGDGNAAEKE